MKLEPENNNSAIAGRSRNTAIAPNHLLNMARGFACLFWGIPPLAMILTNTPDIVLSSHLRIPFLALGVLIMAGGLFLLARVQDPTPRWRQTLRLLFAFLLTATCLAPFLYWWRQFPRVPYYGVNALLLLGVLTELLFLANKLAGETGRTLCDPTFYIESLLSRWAVLISILVPLLVMCGLAIRATWQNPAYTCWELLPLQTDAPRWMFGFFILPFSLTMAMVWKAKNVCFESLTLCAKFPPPAEHAESENPGDKVPPDNN